MKKPAFLSLVLALCLLCACAKSPAGQSSTASSAESSTPAIKEGPINLAFLSGPTGVGAAKLIFDHESQQTENEYAIEILTDNSEITAMLLNGDLDIAAVATNVAANLYNKSDGKITMLCINTLGVLHILDKNAGITSFQDLAGKTLYATGQGANPEYILNLLCAQYQLTPGTDFNIEWLSAPEISAKMLSEESAVCMLPVPAATALLAKDSTITQALDITKVWRECGLGTLAMGCIVARTDFLTHNAALVDTFLEEYAASVAYINHPENTDRGDLVAQYNLVPNAAIANDAIAQCNLTFIAGEDMMDTMRNYFTTLLRETPAAIGGAMPYDDFFYLP